MRRRPLLCFLRNLLLIGVPLVVLLALSQPRPRPHTIGLLHLRGFAFLVGLMIAIWIAADLLLIGLVLASRMSERRHKVDV
jgi:hypothetical protein